MKKNFFKRNKFTRIIAFMLAMIMMAAPFFAHAGLKGDSKAEETAAEKMIHSLEVNLTTNVTDADACITTDDAGNYIIGRNLSGNIVKSILPATPVKYKFAADYLTLKINSSNVTNQINLSPTDNTLVSGKTLSAEFNDEIYYSYEWDVTKIQPLEGNEITITKDDISKTIYFWLKSSVTDDDTPPMSYSTAWQPVYYISFQDFTDIDILNLPKFKNGSNDADSGSYYNSLKYSNSSISGADPLRIGNLYFGYINEADGSFTECSNGTTVSATGTYTPCIRYGFSATDKIVDRKGTTVNIDADAPELSVYLIGKNAAGKEVIKREIINGSSEYISGVVGYSYSVKIVADDGVDGSGIDVTATEIKRMDNVSLSIQETTDGKKTEFEFDIEDNMTYAYTIVDVAGNDNAGAFTINVDNTPPTMVDADIHATVTTASGGAETNIENDGSKYYNSTHNKLTLKATVTDDKAIDKVYLYYKKSSDTTYTKMDITASKSGDVYSYEAIILTMSGDYSFYFEAEDKAGNKTTSAIKTFKVDREPPTFGTPSYYYREGDGSGTTWGEWKAWSPNTQGKYVFNTALMGANEIQYGVDTPATDDFSGLYGWVKKVGSGSMQSSGQWIGITNMYIFPSTELNNATIVEIGLKDNAGNETTTDRNYKLTHDQIAIADTDIKILSNTLKIYETGNENNKLDLGDLTSGNVDINVAINKSYTISVEAVSGYEINGATLSATLSDGASPFSINGSYGASTFDVAEGKNECTVTFEVPGSTILNLKNEWLKNITLKVTDNRPDDVITADHPNFAETTIGQIMYDMSRPRLESTNADKNWHKDFSTLHFVIVSEAYTKEGQSLPDVESGLSWLSYEITNCKGGDKTSDKIPAGMSGITRLDASIDEEIPESLTPYGTIITFNAEDKAGNSIYSDYNANAVVVKVDITAPNITQLTVNNQTGGNHPVPYGGQPVIQTTAYDNLTLDKVVVEVVYPDGITRGKTNTINREGSGTSGITETTNYTVEAVNGKVLEGEYLVKTYAVDKAGWKSGSSQTTFRIDNSKPVVTARVIAGTASPKTAAPYYYKDNVAVELTYQDNNMDSSGVAVSDNGNALGGISWMPVEGASGKYRAVIAVAAEGSHNITINATDISGNKAEQKSIVFVVDKTSPNITAYVNGTTVYNDSMGNLMLTGTTTLSMEVSDMTRDDEDHYVQIQKNVPNEPASNPAYIRTSNTNMTFNDEADYVVNFYSIDRANNTSATKTVRFRVDRTAPELSINGVAGGTSARATTVTFSMREAFWWDSDASLTIYRKAGDGAREELYKTVSFNPSAYQTSVSETLSDTGVYRFEFEARDNVGHRSTLSQTLTIDLDAPNVVLRGVNDYDMTDGAVEFSAEITDDFYSSKTVKISGTRTDMNGKVHKLDFGSFLQSVNPTTISQTFTESGVYNITLVTSDIAGNEHTENVHFTIDNAAPVIGDLSKYDGKIFKSFNWDEDLDELVSDLTVCDVQMFLNGSEYDGSSDIEDGSYVLLIVATDEMGQRTEKEVRFELDTKAPVFIVTGVEDKEVKNEDYIINISLQLDEDTLSQVTLNGTNISVRDNTATINVTEKGEYTLVMKAYDAAGNEAEETIIFTYGEEKSLWWIWIIIACGIILLGTIIIIIVKKKKEDEQ